MLMHCGAMEEDRKAEAERIELSSYPYDERSELWKGVVAKGFINGLEE